MENIFDEIKEDTDTVTEFENDTTLSDVATNYVEKKALNVVDLDEINTKDKVLTHSGIDTTGKAYEYKYILREDIRYRVPISVIIQIKALMESSDVTTFKVTAKGEGMRKRYTTIPLV